MENFPFGYVFQIELPLLLAFKLKMDSTSIIIIFLMKMNCLKNACLAHALEMNFY